ncbi:MAG: hypothetical protein WBP12_05550 [Candidatus Saccharimonas sp.]
MAIVRKPQIVRDQDVITIPAHSVEFVRHEGMNAEGIVKERLHAKFQLVHRTAAWVVEDITEIIVTPVNDRFGVQFVKPNGTVDPNRLVISQDTFLDLMYIWRAVRELDAERFNFPNRPQM